jgi:hypothetical protein
MGITTAFPCYCRPSGFWALVLALQAPKTKEEQQTTQDPGVGVVVVGVEGGGGGGGARGR